MLGKIMRLATITSLLAISLTGASLAVELRNTPYLPSLKPSTPPILGSNNSLNRPAPAHRAAMAQPSAATAETIFRETAS